jgi:hypothetical protein
MYLSFKVQLQLHVPQGLTQGGGAAELQPRKLPKPKNEKKKKIL